MIVCWRAGDKASCNDLINSQERVDQRVFGSLIEVVEHSIPV